MLMYNGPQLIFRYEKQDDILKYVCIETGWQVFKTTRNWQQAVYWDRIWHTVNEPKFR